MSDWESSITSSSRSGYSAIEPRRPLVWVENSDDDDAPEEYRRLPSYPVSSGHNADESHGSSPLTFPSSPGLDHTAASNLTPAPLPDQDAEMTSVAPEGTSVMTMAVDSDEYQDAFPEFDSEVLDQITELN